MEEQGALLFPSETKKGRALLLLVSKGKGGRPSLPIAINAEQKASPCHPPKKDGTGIFRGIKGNKEAALLSLSTKRKGGPLLFLVVRRKDEVAHPFPPWNPRAPIRNLQRKMLDSPPARPPQA